MYTYKLLIHIGFEIYLEQNHKTTANIPDMTWSYLSPLPHTCCISYEEACSLTTRQYSHMLLALKYKSTTSSVKISFLFVYSAWPLSTYFVLSIYSLDILICNISQKFIKTKHCLYDSKYFELIFMSICIFAIMNSTTQWHIDISVSGGYDINYQVHEENNTFWYHLSLFISIKCDKCR